jgi:hypothetical protein
MPSAAEVRARIQHAFAAEAAPAAGDITLHRPCDECEGFTAALAGKHWTAVTPALVGRVKDSLPLLTRAAFRHYLPAFMVGALDDRAAIDTMWDSLIFGLKPRRAGDFEARVAGFSKEQTDAIAAFVEWQGETEHQDAVEHGGTYRADWFAKAVAYWKARFGR